MTKKTLFLLWGVLFALCAGLGFVPEPGSILKGMMSALSVLFFLPPVILLIQADRAKDRNTVLLIRNLASLSLGITLVTLILNFILAVSSEYLGNVLHYVLVVVSTPMICSGYWVLSLFLWSCLLMTSLKILRKKSV